MVSSQLEASDLCVLIGREGLLVLGPAASSSSNLARRRVGLVDRGSRSKSFLARRLHAKLHVRRDEPDKVGTLVSSDT